jgi:pimeloyl-ACP methyl ester carboxylesterase
LAVVAPAAQENVAKPVTPRFEAAACPFKADEKVLAQVRCGYLIVPENRSQPDGRQLRLAVAIARSLSATPRPDAVVLLSGGPGDSFVQGTPRLMNVVMAGLRADRDLIVWDQRGTGHSQPVFCPELSARLRGIETRGLERSALLAQRRQLVTECREAMLRERVDLSQYNTLVSAQDLEDLRRVLGVAQWNLMAVSYGTRLALEAMRLAPQGIRSAVLTSPLPPNPPINVSGAFADVVGRLSRACAAQPDCSAAYPDVEQSLRAAIQELDQKPFVRRPGDGTPDVVINGKRLAQAVMEATRTRRSLALVPMIIGEFRRRNETVIAALTRQLSDASVSRSSRVSRGLNLTVRCHDFLAPALHQSAAPAIPELADFELDASVCDALHPFRAGPQAPVVSDIPTLILTGEFDVPTHRSYGPAAARSLRNSQVLEIRGAGHGESMSEECTRVIVRDFVSNPSAAVDAQCLSTIAPLRFVTDAKAVAK